MRFKTTLRTLIAATALFAACATAYAEMTDEQVIQYVQQQKKNGKTERQIGKELISKGVTPAQLERLRDAHSGSGAQETESGAADKSVMRGRAVEDKEAEGETGLATTTRQEVQKGSANIFGHNVFSTQSLTFEPNENQATPKDYRLGPGDEVIIDIWGESEDRLQQTISPEGSIIVEQLGPIYLNGLTIDQANAHLRKLFASKYAGVGDSATEISLNLGKVRTIQVNIMGEVVTPGTYRLSPFSTIFHALYRSGGITDIGSMRNIEVVRNGRRLAVADVYDFLFNGKNSKNIHLQEGDVIIVPPYETMVRIDGNVKRPMYYETKDGETLADVLAFAGGFSGNAYTEAVRVSRLAGQENELYNVHADEFGGYSMQNGDVVTVGRALDRYTNRVQVRGQVMRPGFYALGAEMLTLRGLIEKAQGLVEDAYTERALIYREGADLTLQVIPVDLGAVLEGSAPDIELQRNDIVEIASLQELNNRGGFTIQGLVADPGTYPYARNTTIDDLILQAGGLLEGASEARIEVARRIVDPTSLHSSNEIAKVFNFEYKGGKVGTPGFLLESNDIVTVRKSPVYMAQQRVAIGGEVTFEGPYTLSQRNERLSDLVNRAGGLTDAAYVRGAHLSRKMTEDEIAARTETIRIARMMQNGESNDSISMEKLVISDRYTVGIDLEKALAAPGGDYDLVLQEGDVLFIPQFISTVRVHGDVIVPNTVSYKDGAKLKYYINQAGGYGERAKKGKAYVVYMNGMVAKASRNVKIEPGCQIIVPSKAPSTGPNWQAIMSVTSVGGTLGTMAAAIATLLK